MRITKLLIILILSVVAGTGIFLLINSKNKIKPTKQNDESSETAQMANPASVYCEENGGILEIRENETGGEIGFCKFDDDSVCEEWAFFNKECKKGDNANTQILDVSKEFAEIKAAAEAELNLDTTTMEVIIKTSTGKYAAGSVSPIEEGVGGGYLFMAKANEVWKVVADGNGTISCEQLAPYPDLPVDMIPECVNANGSIVER